MAKSKTQEEPKKGRAAPVEDLEEEAAAAPPARPAKKAAKASRADDGFDFSRVTFRLRSGGAAAVADTLSTLTKTAVEASDPEFWQGAMDGVPLVAEGEVVGIPVSVSASGARVEGLVLLPRGSAAAVVNLMIGEEADAPLDAFDDLHRSVLAEAVGGVLGGLQEALSDGLGTAVGMAVEGGVEDDASRLADTPVMAVTVGLSAPDGFEGSIALVLPAESTQEMLGRPLTAGRKAAPSMGGMQSFPQLKKDMAGGPAGQNLGILLDVPMQMVAVLGRKGVKLRDLLQMGPGSIMELDKMAGEPLELLVNGKLIGYGEVIVLDEKFGIKVRDVVNPEERMRSANL